MGTKTWLEDRPITLGYFYCGEIVVVALVGERPNLPLFH